MQGVSIFQVYPSRESWLHLPFGNTEAFPNFYSTRGVKLKWGTGRENANQEIQQEGTETTKRKKKKRKLIGNSKIIILCFKYREVFKKEKPWKIFFLPFFSSLFHFFLFHWAPRCSWAGISISLAPSWGKTPTAQYKKNPKPTPKSRTPSPAQSNLSLRLANYPVIVFICCRHSRKCSS